MSGKRAKILRKKSRFSKKKAAMCLGVCIGSAPMVAEGDFLVSFFPHLSKPFGSSAQIQSGVGAGAKLTYRPLDFLNVFVQGDYLSLSLPGVDPINMVSGSVGAGYHLGLTDRISLDFNLNVGGYNAKSTKSMTGVDAGATVTFTYRINPVISADVNASGTHYAAGSKPFMALNAAISPGITFNITEAFSNKTKISVGNETLAPVFPVLYSWYENNDFGNVTITNQEDTSITDVTVSFYQPQYMSNPKECATFGKLAAGESQTVDLYAFFNEQMLELTEKTNTQAIVTVSYSRLGQKKSQDFNLVVPVYGRNNMSWDDDRRAAVFVSSKDPAAMLFGKYVASVVRDNVRSGVPVNIQYAMGIFETLDQFGLSYVIDPTSAFADNVGTSSVDFLQFPYQTLMYRGGDCDDISILVCSLFEAVGIKTAFITIPGHIYMAFDSGLTVQQARENFSSLSEVILDEEYDQVWIPLEITLSDEGFNKAWRVGAREWNTAAASGVACLYAMEDSWQLYPPVSVPGATAYFTMPDRQIVAKLFDHSVDQWITKEIETQVKYYEAKLAIKDDSATRNSLGILYGKYGMFVQADEQFKKARRNGYVPSILNTGNIYYSKQDYDRARKWYKSVLKEEPDNVLALLGVARCAYELTDYTECDAAYSRVMQMNPELAAEYAYLGSFVNTKGRAFSLADRLQNTIWSEEKEEIPEALKEAVESKDDDEKVVLTESEQADKSLADLLSFDIESVALAPEAETKDEEEDLEDYDIAAGDGNPPKKNIEQALETPELEEDPEVEPEVEIAAVELQVTEEKTIEEKASSFTEQFTGLSSEIGLQSEDLFALDLEALIAAAPVVEEAAPVAELVEAPVEEELALVPELVEAPIEESIEEPTEEFLRQAQEPLAEEEALVEEELAPVPELVEGPELVVAPAVEEPAEEFLRQAQEPLTEEESLPEIIIPMEVPRFTEAPSSEWAPKEAYTAEVIPGMKSFQEEMGEYQNEKAFLYEEDVTLSVDPENDTEENDLQAETTQYAMAGTPDVNPFSSYLSKEDAKVVEEITQFKMEEYVPPVVVEKTPAVVVEKTPVVAEKTSVVIEPAPVVAELVEAPVVEKTPVVIEKTPAVVETSADQSLRQAQGPELTVEEPAPTVEAPAPVVAELVEAPAEAPAPVVAELVEAPAEAPAPAVVVEAPAPAETPTPTVEATTVVEPAPAEPQPAKTNKGLLALALAFVAGGAGAAIMIKKTIKKRKEEDEK